MNDSTPVDTPEPVHAFPLKYQTLLMWNQVRILKHTSRCRSVPTPTIRQGLGARAIEMEARSAHPLGRMGARTQLGEATLPWRTGHFCWTPGNLSPALQAPFSSNLPSCELVCWEPKPKEGNCPALQPEPTGTEGGTPFMITWKGGEGARHPSRAHV